MTTAEAWVDTALSDTQINYFGLLPIPCALLLVTVGG